MKIRWTKVLRELWGNKARSILVVISIAVGVFSVGTIANSWVVLLDDLNSAYLATNPASATLSLSPFDDDLVSAVENRREVAVAEGRQSVVMTLYTPQGIGINLNLLAVDDFEAVQLNQMTPESGAWPPLRRQLLLERSWMAELGLEENQSVIVETADGTKYELLLAGTAHDLHVISAGNTEVATGYVTMDTLQYMGQDRFYNVLYLTVAENDQDQDYIASVVTTLKSQVIESNGYTVFSTTIPTPGEAFLTVIITALLGVLAIVGLFTLLLSGALVVNTVSAVITRQMQQIGVMKAVGGSQRQITEIYIVSILVYGLLSLGIAVPLAVVGTQAFTETFAQIGNFDIQTTAVPPGVIGLEVLVGLLVPTLAALIPIRRGTQITVREAITSQGIGDTLGASLLDRFSTQVRVLPESVLLSLRNTFRRKTRLALTLGTLTLAGAIFVAVLSVRDSLFASFDEALVYYGYDLSVDLGEDYRLNQIEREADRIDGITSVEGWLVRAAARVRPDETESTNYPVYGVPADSQFLAPELVEGRWIQPGDRSKIVVNTDFVREEENIAVGDTITLKIGLEDQDWEVIGIATKQYSTPIIYVGRDDLGRAIDAVGLANRALVKLDNPAPETETIVAGQLEDRFKKAGLTIGSTTTRSDFIETFSFRFNFLVIFLIFLAVLLAVVGGLGLAGTMGLNVLERIREIGVIRAIGGTDRRIQRIIISEGVLIGVLSWIIAAIISVPLSYVMSNGVGIAFGGEPLSFNFSFVGLGVWLALVLLIAALSSYFPARRASRLSVREILAYE